jgi:hypothetical protein
VSTITEPPEAKPKTGNGKPPNPLLHCFCACTPDIALCGHRRISPKKGPMFWMPPPKDRCVVCSDLYLKPCSRCERTPL